MTEQLSSLSQLPRRAIRLRIAGGDLLLNGSFHNWQSTLTRGDNLDEAAVHLVVDSTSLRRSLGDDDDSELFSFESTKVRRAGVGAYAVSGTMKPVDGASHPLEVLVETPTAHTAFFGLSFLARRADLGDSWDELIATSKTNMLPAAAQPQEMNAQAWLRMPVLAAA